MAATAGIVRPMLASADPKAKFKLVCNLLARAAFKAAKNSGSNTKVAMTMPTTGLGAPTLATKSSTVGVNAFARPTTATRDRSSNPTLMIEFAGWPRRPPARIPMAGILGDVGATKPRPTARPGRPFAVLGIWIPAEALWPSLSRSGRLRIFQQSIRGFSAVCPISLGFPSVLEEGPSA